MPPIQPGQDLGPYRIIDQIGKGGMATVYKAYHAAMDRYVAVKILSGELAQDELLKGRFQQEARLIANLEHAHILPVHDFGESDGVYYIVMRYLDMGTLKDRIESGPMSLEEIDRIFTQLADALGYAHDHGVLHRDIKPSNVLMDKRGNVFLTDFGIAKIMEGTTQFTVSGTITGTPAYMSPEQAQGETLDPRTDIYSLGIILYEMVTGRVPFEAETPLAVILKHLQEPLPLPTKIRPEVHPAVERVLLKALAKNRDHRYTGCPEFLAAWKRALAEAASASPAQPGAGQALFQEPAPEPKSEAPTVIETLAKQAEAGPPARQEPQPKPAARTASYLWAGGAILAGVILVFGVIWAGMRLISSINAPVLTESPATSGSSGTGTSDSQPDSTTPAGSSGSSFSFTSWSSANLITHLQLSADTQSIYSAGPGGVTVWNRQDGSIVRRITGADGLANTHVNAILLQEDQAVWIGTEEGLFRLDDDQVNTYGSEDGLDSDYISALLWLEGKVMAGTQYSDRVGGGLNVLEAGGWQTFDPAFPSAHPDAATPNQLSNAVTALLKDGTNLWVGTNHGLGRYNGESWTQYHVENGLPGENVLALYLDRGGQVWAGTEEGAAVFNGDGFDRLPQGPPDGVFGIVEDPDGSTWLSGGGGLWHYDAANSDWQVYSTDKGDLPVYETYGALADPEGNLYFGSYGAGLVVIRPDRSIQIWSVPNSPFGASLAGILPMPDGKLWFIASNGASVDVFDPQSSQWSRPPEDLPGLPIFADDQDRIWMNEWPSGVWAVSPGGERMHIADRQGLPAEAFVNSVVVSGDKAWLGTEPGLAEFDGAQIVEFLPGRQIGLKEDSIQRVWMDATQSLWVLGPTSYARRESGGSWEVFGDKNPLSDEWVQVYDIDQDRQGGMWVATSEGAYRLAEGNWRRYTYGDPGVSLPSPTVLCVTSAPDGSLWFGTDRGAARYDGSAWQTFSAGPEGLISPYINDIYVSAAGEIFFATAGGVTRLQP